MWCWYILIKSEFDVETIGGHVGGLLLGKAWIVVVRWLVRLFPLRITVDVSAGSGQELLTCVLVLIMLLLFKLDKN